MGGCSSREVFPQSVDTVLPQVAYMELTSGQIWRAYKALQKSMLIPFCITWKTSRHTDNGFAILWLLIGIRWAESAYLHSRHSGRGYPRRDQQSSLLT